MGNSFFGILQIIPRKLKISGESHVVTGVLGSLLDFAPDILWAESVDDIIGHNGTMKRDELSSMKDII